ncbi:MAG TPA: ornithine cyclodeaminase family protein [Thermoanaerobaculia bacterium]|nr:ornithine cyclodeaminase family protein [Thermoanaerobaculia bacterium]
MPLRFLNRRDVRDLLPMGECIERMADILTALAKGEASHPLRSVFWLPGQPGQPGQPEQPEKARRDLMVSMPSERSAPPEKAALAMKVLTIFEGNHGAGLDSHLGFVLLFDGRRGEPVAILDAATVTGIRTAAASAVATRLLAQEKASDLAILGTGVQARSHLQAMREVRPVARVRVWSRDVSRAERFAAEMSAEHPLPVEAVASAEAAVAGADLICTTTAAREPVLSGEWLSPGTHVNAVGACTPATRELDTRAVQRARFFGDRRESVLNEAGDFLIPKKEGAIGDAHLLGDFSDLLLGRVPGRLTPEDVTIFESLGIAVEDLAAAQHVYAKAVELGRGIELEL